MPAPSQAKSSPAKRSPKFKPFRRPNRIKPRFRPLLSALTPAELEHLHRRLVAENALYESVVKEMKEKFGRSISVSSLSRWYSEHLAARPKHDHPHEQVADLLLDLPGGIQVIARSATVRLPGGGQIGVRPVKGILEGGVSK